MDEDVQASSVGGEQPPEVTEEPAGVAEEPTEPAPAAAEPADEELAPPATEAADAEPASAEPADAEPASAEPADAEPASAEPAEAEPATAAAEPVDAEPAAVPGDAGPASAEPVEDEPAPAAAEPAEAEAADAEPAGEAASAEPVAAEAAEPAPAEAANKAPPAANPASAATAKPAAGPASTGEVKVAKVVAVAGKPTSTGEVKVAKVVAPAAKPAAKPAAAAPAEDAGPSAEAPSEGAGEPGEAAASGGADVVWEEVEESAAPVAADPEALARAVEAFLASDPMSRDGKGRELREQAVALRETNAFEPLAQAVERLALEAGDPPDEACIAMAQSLLSPGAASRIVAILGTTRDDARRAELTLVCQRVGHEMALAVADALSDTTTTDRYARRTFLDCMVAMGEAAMPVVQEMAQDSRWFVARNAVSILGETGGDRAVELITGTLAHKDPKVRREALMALAKVGGDDAGQLVYGMLEDSDSDVRFAAAMAAGSLKVERALRPLLALLEDEEDDDVTVSILRALGQLGDPGAVATVEKYTVTTFFSRLPSEVRIAAYRALHNIGTPHAKEVIGVAVDDKDPEVRAAVRRLLGSD